MRTEGSVLVQAIDETEVDLIVFGGGVGGSAGVGAGIGVAVITKTTTAEIADSARVTGEGNSFIDGVRTGQFVLGAPGSSKTGVNDSAFDFNTSRPGKDDLEVGVPDVSTEEDVYETEDREGNPEGAGDDIQDPVPSNEQVRNADFRDGFRGVAVSATAKDDIESIALGFAAAVRSRWVSVRR